MQVRPRPIQPSLSASAERKAHPVERQHAPAEPLEHGGVLRAGVATYVIALLVIAAFSIAFHFITDNIVHRQDATARVVNISGRQRMLVQRIVRLSLERSAHTHFDTEAQTQAELKGAVGLLASSHEALLHGSSELRIQAPTEPEVLAVYTKAPYTLDAQVAVFLQHARALAARPSSELTVEDPDLVAMVRAVQSPLLEALNAAVSAKQASSEAWIAHLSKVLTRLTLAMLAILLAEALFLYRPLFKRLGLAHAELLELGRTDPLTGCLNRRAFTQEAHALVEEAHSGGQGLAVMMIDIDHFKSINDRFGHAAGDDVIYELVSRLLGRMRSAHRLCRMGGEEFAILMRDATMEGAAEMAEEFRELVAATDFLVRGQAETLAIKVTVSVGVAELMGADASIFTVLGRADKALYRAKQQGRNRVEMEEYEAPSVVAVMGARG